jgi:hypothetical protein
MPGFINSTRRSGFSVAILPTTTSYQTRQTEKNLKQRKQTLFISQRKAKKRRSDKTTDNKETSEEEKGKKKKKKKKKKTPRNKQGGKMPHFRVHNNVVLYLMLSLQFREMVPFFRPPSLSHYQHTKQDQANP